MQLFMIQLRASDWRHLRAWYRDVLGLNVLMEDVAGGFALLDAGPTKLAIKARREGETVLPSDSALVFQVEDLDGERRRLARLGVVAGEIVENRAEGFRECGITDPQGNSITLFAWHRRS
jgi:predicted enzyme related to lactoylglutathione lyase